MIMDSDIRRVFDAWRAYKDRPELCRFNDDRRDLIRKRMDRGYSADDLVTLMRYAHEADADECRFWRGEDGGRSYLGLDNLLRATKLADRVERALLWASDLGGPGPIEGLPDDPDDPDDHDGDVVFDFVGALRRSRRR